jgi:hypothetical protein
MRNSADLTVEFTTNAPTIDVAVGYNRTNTSQIPKLVLSQLANRAGIQISRDHTLTRAVPGNLTKHEPHAATPGDPGIAGG